MAQLGHFERLCLSVRHLYERFGIDAYRDCEPFEFDKVTRVAEAVVRAINGNPMLAHLDLSPTPRQYLDWAPHLPTIARAMEDHKGLRTFVVLGDDPNDDDDFAYFFPSPELAWLERLLARNRKIRVENPSGNVISNGYPIDKLLLVNKIYDQSEKLAAEAMPSRMSLVAAALTNDIAARFAYMGLLLSHHTGVVCEFLQDVNDNHLAPPDFTLDRLIDELPIPAKVMFAAMMEADLVSKGIL